jgi:hypothetical protein
METINSLEKKLVEVNKTLPQIPESGKKVLADWFWVLLVIGVVVGVMGILTILGIGASGSLLLTGLGAGAYVAATLWPSIVFGVIGMAIVIVIEAMAIGPAKNKEHRGWQLVFIAVLLQFVISVLQNIFINDYTSVLGSLIGLAIGLYLLVQVHSYFIKGGHVVSHRKK